MFGKKLNIVKINRELSSRSGRTESRWAESVEWDAIRALEKYGAIVAPNTATTGYDCTTGCGRKSYGINDRKGRNTGHRLIVATIDRLDGKTDIDMQVTY